MFPSGTSEMASDFELEDVPKINIKFKNKLIDNGLTECSVAIVANEMISDESIFVMLQREHLDRLLPLMKVGQHAQLLMIWEQMKDERLVSTGS